jgi:glyceraldehyde 3-phosphate dehydrogenase
MKVTAGINGFGRFGLHLLKYWLERADKSNFVISYINDDYLDIDRAFEIINTDKSVLFNEYVVTKIGNQLIFVTANGQEFCITYSCEHQRNIPWRGVTDFVLECSGKCAQDRTSCGYYLTGDTKLVIISATAPIADQTLVYGFNDQEFNQELAIISYGSCTVNAYVPFANFMHHTFGLIDSDVNVIHNIVGYKLPEFNTLKRQTCTLEKAGLKLLNFLNEKNFVVNYTIIPYAGISTIDFRFKLQNATNLDDIISKLEFACKDGVLKGLYSLETTDTGPEAHNCTTFSSVFIKDNLRLIGDNLYLFAYFDNENSVNRYFDLTQNISQLYT